MQANNYTRILRNTGLLYFRMLLTMAVTLYTSRIVLNALGVEDFGIFHLVGGCITILGFLHGAISSATQRFLTFEMGKPEQNSLRNIFSMSLNIHLLIAAGIFFAGETAGIWFIKTQLAIPPERITAATWVFHLSLLAFLVSIISTPYNAIIIAHEHMSAFAKISIIDASLKLLIVFMLPWFNSDSLISYAVLMLVVATLIATTYRLYCRRRFHESRFVLYWDKSLFNTMLSYMGWSTWGNLAAVMGNQGINVILNIFFGPPINAARTIAFQVSTALNSFVQNLQTAANPQIIKSYAANDLNHMHNLVCYGAKYNFFLLLLLSLPMLVETEKILLLWLIKTPPYTAEFIKIIIINILLDSISAPLITTAQATGNIKRYQILVGGILLTSLPISYILISQGLEPNLITIANIITSALALITRLIILRPILKSAIRKFLIEAIYRTSLTTIATITLFLAASELVGYEEGDILMCIILSPICMLAGAAIFGLSSAEKNGLKLLIAKNKYNIFRQKKHDYL